MNNDNRFIIIDDDDMEDIVDLNMLPPQSSSSSSRSTQNNNSNNNSEPIEISDEEEDIICLSKQPTNQGSCFTFIHSPEPGQQRSPQQPSSDVGYYNHSWNFASIGGSSSTNYHETHEDADGYDSDCQIVENPNTAAAKMASTSSLTPSSSSSSSTALRTTAATLSTSAASSRRLGKQMARNRSPTPSAHTSSNSSSGSTTNKPSSSSQRGPVLNPPLMINSTPRPQEQEQQPNQQVEDRSPVSFSLFHTAEGFDESEDIDLGSNIRFEKEEEDLAARSTAAASPTLHEPAEATTILPPQDNNNTMGQPGSLERNNNKQQHYEPKPVEPPPPLPRLDCAACLASKPQFRVAEIEVYGFPLDARTADQLNTFERNLNIDNAKPAMTPEDIAADMFILDSAGVHTTSIEAQNAAAEPLATAMEHDEGGPKQQQQQQLTQQRRRKRDEDSNSDHTMLVPSANKLPAQQLTARQESLQATKQKKAQSKKQHLDLLKLLKATSSSSIEFLLHSRYTEAYIHSQRDKEDSNDTQVHEDNDLEQDLCTLLYNPYLPITRAQRCHASNIIFEYFAQIQQERAEAIAEALDIERIHNLLATSSVVSTSNDAAILKQTTISSKKTNSKTKAISLGKVKGNGKVEKSRAIAKPTTTIKIDNSGLITENELELTEEDKKFLASVNDADGMKLRPHPVPGKKGAYGALHGHEGRKYNAPLFTIYDRFIDMSHHPIYSMHWPTQAGIACGHEGAAYSIVLANGRYPNADKGDVVIYIGKGKFEDMVDQELEGGNKALVGNFEKKIPVRLIRGSTCPSKYAPESGYRYDGLYWVVGYKHERHPQLGIKYFKFKLVRLSGQAPLPVRRNHGEGISNNNSSTSNNNEAEEA